VHIFFYVTCWILDITNIIHIKQAPVNAMKADGELRVQRHSFLTSALDGGKWPVSHHLLWGKRPHYKQHRKLDGLYSQSGHSEEEKNPCPCQEFNHLTQTSTLEPSHYTDYTTPAPEVYLIYLLLQ